MQRMERFTSIPHASISALQNLHIKQYPAIERLLALPGALGGP